MGHAKTQRGAAYRVKMKHGLRAKGFKVSSEITTKALEKKYRAHVGPCPKR